MGGFPGRIGAAGSTEACASRRTSSTKSRKAKTKNNVRLLLGPVPFEKVVGVPYTPSARIDHLIPI